MEEYIVTGRIKPPKEEVKIHDLGDLNISIGGREINLKKLETLIQILIDKGKKPIIIGGEHLATYPTLKALSKRNSTILVYFDAHADMYDEYPIGVKYSHATVLRRIVDESKVEKVILLGFRAISKPEYKELQTYVKQGKIEVVRADEIGCQETLRRVLKEIEDKKIYISIDMDVYDPSIAPGVSNPEPHGILAREAFLYLYEIVVKAKEILGIDVVETNPIYDPSGQTIALATRTLYLILQALSSK